MDTSKLKMKDLITTAIFTVIFMIILFASFGTIGMIPLGNPFAVAIGMIPGGIVWTYMRAKVPKRFTIIIQCVLMAIIYYVIGTGWFVAIGSLAGGILAELLTGIGKYRSSKWNIAGYAAFGACLQLGTFAIILLARDYYYEYCVTYGANKGLTDFLLGFMNWPTLLLTTLLTIAGAVIGMLLGKVFLKKHFEKAGIV
ncbi:MAG: MptD family putative ECF transporter S component [Coriobacteriales bacterium]|jgi:energy-coupling factor transport system substrate-specific component|nr:MptD family putative ECF transporter S component [Coriobacteriales bacterium]